MITPAISVLSALEGIEVAVPEPHRLHFQTVPLASLLINRVHSSECRLIPGDQVRDLLLELPDLLDRARPAAEGDVGEIGVTDLVGPQQRVHHHHVAFATGTGHAAPHLSCWLAIGPAENRLAGARLDGPIATRRGSQTEPSNPATTTVKVSKSGSDLIVTDGASHILMYAPVTSGSEHDPLPIGEWKVLGVQHHPRFHYNPELFWDAKATDAKATIQPGPNNPVGVVWIDLSRPHYGLHGTPEPSLIGKTTSHGCVRLTNWDAEKLAGLVRPGTKVLFTE